MIKYNDKKKVVKQKKTVKKKPETKKSKEDVVFNIKVTKKTTKKK